jgi:hypothetical protein
VSRKATIIVSLLLAALLFGVGLLVYDSVLSIVVGDYSKRIIAVTIEEPFFHMLKWALSLALAGVSVGFSTLFHGQFSKIFSYTYVLFAYFLVGVVTGIGWTGYLTYRFMHLDDYVSFDLSKTMEVSVPLSIIPLHHIGLLVSGTLLSIALAHRLSRIRSQ